jgi:hypothetical protein
MAIPAVAATYLNAGPSFTGQILAASASLQQELAYIGTATFVLDGTLTTATLNFIDGTQALPYTPSAVAAMVVGGTQPAAAFVSVSTGSITTTGCTVRFSAAGTNANTVQIAFFVLK